MDRHAPSPADAQRVSASSARRNRLVEQQHLWFHGERAASPTRCFIAAGNLGRPLSLAMRHLHQLEIVLVQSCRSSRERVDENTCPPRADV